MGAGGVGRRVAGAVALWAVVLVGVRATVLLPEQCPPVTVEGIDAAVDETIGWFERNQAADGTWLYRYDRDLDEVVPGYNVVRHSGVTMSLYQAAAAGHDDARRVADAGAAYALAHLVPTSGDGRAFEPGSARPSSGASALLLAGLAERRADTGDDRFDTDMRALASFLVSMTDERGAVYGSWDPDTREPVPESWSPFYTGETFWALALAERELPGEGYGEVAERIGRYLATERDEAEGYWPDVPDHWAAYGFEVLTGDLGVVLDTDEVDYLRRQAAFGGIQTRYESQRQDDWPRWLLRGRRTLGAGLGTVGEQMGNIEPITTTDERLGDLRGDVAERTVCVAGMLAERQITADEASQWVDPDRTAGAWFQFEVTQMDDQQHAMSALLLARPLVDAGVTGHDSGDLEEAS